MGLGPGRRSAAPAFGGRDVIESWLPPFAAAVAAAVGAVAVPDVLAGAAVALALILAAGPRPEHLSQGRWRHGPLLGSAGGAAVALGLIVHFGGLLLAALALVLGGVGWLFFARARRRKRRRLRRAELVEAAELMAAELDAGLAPTACLVYAAQTWAWLSPVARAHELGGEVAAALRAASREAGQGDLALVAAAWQVGEQCGGGIRRAMAATAEHLRAEAAAERVVAGELASARATGRLVAALPIVLGGVGTAMGADPLGFLLSGPVGHGCLVVGLGMGLAGLWWIEALADRAVPAR